MDEHRVVADEELLHLAAEILSSVDYTIEKAATEDGYPLVLAENPFFVLIVGATSTIAELPIAESLATAYFDARIKDVEVGAKRWDVNVILLTSQQLGREAPDTRALFDLNYDTRSVRRLARAGVQATPAGVREALRPFVPPIDYVQPADPEDPLTSLIDALEMSGVDRALGERAVGIFQERGDMSGVF